MYPQHYLIIFLIFFVGHISASALHGQCLSDEDCGTIDTYCRNDTCVCKENFTVWLDSCLAVTNPKVTCLRKHDCHPYLGSRSMCTKKQICACKPFHHLHNGQCVKNKDLHDTCEHDHQCYCGAGCENKIACIDKNCSCKPGHMPYRIRRCIHDPMYVHVEMLPSQSPMRIFNDNNNSSLVANSFGSCLIENTILMIIISTVTIVYF